jgi:uncharacterized protein
MSEQSPDSASNIPPKPDAPPADSQAPPPPAETGPLPVAQNQDDKTMGMLCHLLGIFLGIIGPLLIWLLKKEQSKFVDDQGKEAVNFQIVMLILHVVGAPISFFTCGAATGIILVLNLIFCIMGGLEANKGIAYRYPFNLRLIK